MTNTTQPLSSFEPVPAPRCECEGDDRDAEVRQKFAEVEERNKCLDLDLQRYEKIILPAGLNPAQ